MQKGIFLTVKDMMKLLGSDNYGSCANYHKSIRTSIAKGKKKLTVKEYCEHEILDFDYIWKFIRS